MNLFATILTYAAPSSNYRGESEENRTVIQKISRGRFEYPIISPEAMRNALRESLAGMEDIKCNRTRVHDENQLAVKFKDYPNPEKFADDFFFGWLIAASSDDRKKIKKELKERSRNVDDFKYKRDSIIRMNLAVGLQPYRYDTVFTQSPKDVTPKEIKNHKNADSSQLLHRETVFTAFQYPFALNLEECRPKASWTKKLLKVLGELGSVAGNHARSYFEMSPASIVIRLTDQLVAGYDTYGFKVNEQGNHTLPEIVDGILQGDYPGDEFYLSGKIVRDMDDETIKKLQKKGVTLERSPQKLLEKVGNEAFAQEKVG